MSVPTDAELRGLRIIALALTSGVAIFLLFVLAMDEPEWPEEGKPEPFLSFIALLFAGSSLPIAVVLRKAFTTRARKNLPASPNARATVLFEAYRGVTITSMALLEAPGLLAVTAYMLERTLLALGAAVAMIVIMVSQIPGTGAGRVREWIERQIRLADEEGTLSASGRDT